MQPTLETLERFAIPNRVSFDTGSGGLVRVKLRGGGAEGEVYLHGAHVTGFTPPGGKGLLFLSGESLFQADKPIRGGVPIIFPWFGPRAADPVGNSPMHGFARVSEWEVESTEHDANSTSITLRLGPTAASRGLWDHAFVLRYRVTVAEKLTLALCVENTGSTQFRFEEALHTYLVVGDVRECGIEGLAGVTYIDKTDQMARKVQSGAIRITAETDRVYLDTASTCVVSDPKNGRKISVSKENSLASVVWNPWVAKAKAMADFGDEEWRGMICIETCNVNENAVELGGGGRHVMRAEIGEMAIG